MNRPSDSGQLIRPIEEAGSAKEVAEKVRQGKASLQIVETPWGVEFHISEPKAGAKLWTHQRRETLPALAKLLFATGKTGRSSNSQVPTGWATNLRSVVERPSYLVLVFVCVLSNYVAFAVSRPSMGYVELDPLVSPGSFASLARTEVMILVFSFVLLAFVSDFVLRTAMQGLVAGFFTADAVNDIVLVFTGGQFLAMELAWVTAASIPMAVGIYLLQAQRPRGRS